MPLLPACITPDAVSRGCLPPPRLLLLCSAPPAVALATAAACLYCCRQHPPTLAPKRPGRTHADPIPIQHGTHCRDEHCTAPQHRRACHQLMPSPSPTPPVPAYIAYVTIRMFGGKVGKHRMPLPPPSQSPDQYDRMVGRACASNERRLFSKPPCLGTPPHTILNPPGGASEGQPDPREARAAGNLEKNTITK